MKYYDKMHYEKELDLFCRCIRANISIILHKTVYEINSTLLLRTHFKPPSSVCNNFILRSHTLWAAAVHYISSPKKPQPTALSFFPRLYFQNSPLVRGKTPTCSLYPFHIWAGPLLVGWKVVTILGAPHKIQEFYYIGPCSVNNSNILLVV